MRRERDRRTQSRRDSFAAFVASLSPKVWLDATGLTPGLLSTWPSLGSVGDATAAGALRPTATGGTEVTFSGGQRMETPAFAMGARSSGACVARFSATNQGAFQFSALNSHHSCLAQNFPADQIKIRAIAGGSGDAGIAASYPHSAVFSWSFDNSGGTVLINGVSVGIAPTSGIPPTTDVLTIGDLTLGIFALTGAIHEIVIVDAVISGADLTALHSGMRAKWGI